MASLTAHFPSYIYRRQHTFYYRKRIPKKFLHFFNLSELRLSLGVSSVRTAIQKSTKIHSRVEQIFEFLNQITGCSGDLKQKALEGMENLTEENIKDLVTKFYQDTKKDVEESWLQRKFKDERSMLAEIDSHKKVFASLKEDLICNRFDDFSDTVKEFLNSEGISNVAEESVPFRKLCRDCYAASIQASKEVLQNLSDPFTKVQNYVHNNQKEEKPITKAIIEQPTEPAYTVAQAIQDYADESLRTGNWTAKTKGEQISCLELLQEILGTQTEVRSIGRKQMAEVKGTLLRFPTNRNKDRRYRGKSISEILKMDVNPLSNRTVNNYLIRYSSFFNWLKRREEISTNPAEGLAIKSNRSPRAERAVFSKDELFKMLEMLKPEQKRPERYYITLLGLYTGARLNELCQLDTKDVITTEDGIRCISINTKGDPKKSVKTNYAVRDIPIHQDLIELGFLDYVNQRSVLNKKKLWNLNFDEKERYKRQISRWFNVRFKPKFITLDTNGKKDFHSLRHTLITYLMSKNIEEPVVASIVGHHVDSITFGRYGKGYPLATLESAINKVDYYGIDVVRFLKA